MTAQEYIVLTFATITCFSALLLLLSKNLVKALILLFVVLLGTAALFVLNGGDFLAMAQVILYLGGILILIMFGVMLTQKGRSEEAQSGWSFPLSAATISGIIFCGLMLMVAESRKALETNPSINFNPTTEIIANILTNQWVFAFEAISVLLLIAMLGAAWISGIRNEKIA